jgi:hypothetical protein
LAGGGVWTKRGHDDAAGRASVTAINAYAASHCISAVIASSFASFCIVFTVETRVVFGQHVLEK